MRSSTTIRLVTASDPATMQGMAAKLTALAERLDTPNSFEKGQIVFWKPGLRNRAFPEYGEAVIVRAVLPRPVFDKSVDCAASPYFQEPLTLVIGIFREDDLLEFRVDGRRFEPVRD
jgi:hypothetical protein